MEVKIYETEQRKQSGIENWRDQMTDAEYERGQFYLQEYQLRLTEIQKNKQLWDRIEELCACQREADADDPDYPNSFIALLTPCVEGQVASIIEGNIEFTHFADNPLHKDIMKKYDAASEYFRRKNHFIDHFKDYTREYEKLGNAIVTVSWENTLMKTKGKPNGFPRVTVCPPLTVIFDGRIKDAKDIQYSEYAIHLIGFQTIGWARKTYGDDKANALSIGYNQYEGEHPDRSVDDDYTFLLLHVWTRNNEPGNLQLIEMDANGFILRESDPATPYYTNVDNEYPFYMSRMIPIVGQLYGYGDGMLLKGLQEYQNNLADEVELAARFSAQSKVIVDPRAEMGADQLNSNPADIAIAKDPNQNIKVLTGTGINAIVPQIMMQNEARAQRITRFNDIMTGNQQGVSATATQINSQMVQGSVGIADKKSDIARAMEWVDRYCLKLAQQYCDKGFWVAVGGKSENAEYVDFKDMMTAPGAQPIGDSVQNKLLQKIKTFGKKKPPKWDLSKNEKGEVVDLDIDFYTKVYIGRGINKDKTTMYNILVGLAGLLGRNEQGQPVPVISFKQLVSYMEDVLGLKLQDDERDMSQVQTDIAGLLGQNPIGQNGTIQKQQPVAENLMQTVPQVTSGDNRRLSL